MIHLKPMPLYVSARSLNEPLDTYVDRLYQGAGISFAEIDEVGVRRANTLLEKLGSMREPMQER